MATMHRHRGISMPAKRSSRIVIDGTSMTWGRPKKKWSDRVGCGAVRWSPYILH